MNNPLQAFAMNMLSQNPNISQNPQAQNYMNVIRSGDNARGEQIANNLCNSFGISREQALQMAMNFFGMNRR